MKITAAQYQQARKAIASKAGVSPSNYAFRHVLGISLRQAQRYESGETRVPPIVARLMAMFLRFGVPPELQSQWIGRGVANRRASELPKAKRDKEGTHATREHGAERTKEKASVA